MRRDSSSLLPTVIILGGLALWMTIAVLNNVTDRGTNIAHLEAMLTMSLLIDDPIFGNGLEWRSLPPGYASAFLWCVSAAQVIIAAALWRATFAFVCTMRQSYRLAIAVRRANVGLGLFLGLWLFFLCGGLWFGYWMKQGPIQGVHLTLILVSLGAVILVNQDQGTRPGETEVSGK